MVSQITIFAVILMAGVASSCMCPKLYLPVCASNGQTFPNGCSLRCHNRDNDDNLTVVARGQCKEQKKESSCMCPKLYLPVCASNGQTFPNGCSLRCHNRDNDDNLTVVARGQCKEQKKESSCMCPKIYLPVCASNGQTFPNGCSLRCHNRDNDDNLTVVARGQCKEQKKESPCKCFKIYRPVCASNGQTFPDNCILRCHNHKNDDNLSVVAEGPCDEQEKESSCICPMTYLPVCASNGQTFSNECLLECHNRNTRDNLSVVAEGRCEEQKKESPCICPKLLSPVCASNGQTFTNECYLDCHNRDNDDNLSVVARGQCKEQKKESSCLCSSIYLPVCASNGQTFSSDCLLECHNRNTRDNLSFVAEGRCEEQKKESPCICPKLLRPVCASNGQTFSNKCLLECHNRDNDDNLSVVARGQCKEQKKEPPCVCPKIHSPVCASNGQTFPNECSLGCFNRKHDAYLTVVAQGQCNENKEDSSCRCPLIFHPICSSNGKTFSSPCRFHCYNRGNNYELKIAHFGKCKEQQGLDLETPCTCTKEYMPVCGSDHKIYNNRCLFNCAAMKDKSLRIENPRFCYSYDD